MARKESLSRKDLLTSMRAVLNTYCKMIASRFTGKKKHNFISIEDFGINAEQKDDVTAVKLHQFARDAPK